MTSNALKKENNIRYETLLFQRENGIGIITFNRPDRLNTISSQILDELNSLLDEIESDALRVVILTGNKRSFCAGFDLKETMTPEISQKYNKLINRLESFCKPIIAAIDGYALGGGCEIALCCDLRVASETASIGMPEVKVGIIPSGGVTYRLLPRIIGLGRAKEMLYLGESLSGREAFNIGLVNRVAPPGKALDEAKKLAGILLDRPPLSIKAIKNCVQAGTQLDSEGAANFVMNAANLLRPTEDYIEGRKAFQEKRKPIWKGK